jgi:acyl-CoA thioesterase
MSGGTAARPDAAKPGTPKPGTPQEVARVCADALWAQDQASRGLGMELLEVGPGRAVMRMTITPAMANGLGIAHGGFLYTLADSAFAFACNSYGDRAVASAGSITYLRPGKIGDVLTAVAQMRARSGKSGIYDVQLRDPAGTVIAEFRGISRAIGSFFDAPKPTS